MNYGIIMKTEKSTLKKRLQSYHNPKLIPKYHESCKNHELRQIMNNKDEKECHYEIHIKCLKGHKLTETSANECNDYELTDENFVWKFEVMKKIREDLIYKWFEKIHPHCPYCNAKLPIYAYYDDHYGPFRTCPKCNKTIYEKEEYNE